MVLSAAKQAAYKALNDDVLAAYTCGAKESLAGAALRVRSRCEAMSDGMADDSDSDEPALQNAKRACRRELYAETKRAQKALEDAVASAQSRYQWIHRKLQQRQRTICDL